MKGGKVFVLIAKGPNDIEVPCLIFEDHVKCAEFLADKGIDFTLSCSYEGERVEFNGNGDYQELSGKQANALFTRYSDGCGGCWRVVGRYIAFGDKFVGWDLD